MTALPTTPARHVRPGDVVAFQFPDSCMGPTGREGTMVAVTRVERGYCGYPTLLIHTEDGTMMIGPDAQVEGFTAWAREGLEGLS